MVGDNLFVLTIAIAFTHNTAFALRAFDCSHENTTFFPIDLIEPQRCESPEAAYFPPQKVLTQILQTARQRSVKGYSCAITLSKEICRCGFSSLNYGCTIPYTDRIIELTPAECRKAVKEKKVKVENKVYEIELGRPLSSSFYSEGSLSRDGHCTTATFTTDDKLYEKSYESTTVDIHIDVILGIVDLASGLVRFSNGLRENFKSEVIRDAMMGTIVWTADELPCIETVSELYKGFVELYEEKSYGLLGSIVLLENKETGQYAGLIMKEERQVCRTACRNTQIDGIVICLFMGDDVTLPHAAFKESYDPQRNDILSQLGYSHLKTNLQMYKSFENVYLEICTNERRTLYNKLQAIAGSESSSYNILDVYGPGHQIFPAGATAYIAKCVEVRVERIEATNCSLEVPLIYNNTKVFADPLTWIVQPFPTIIPCSEVMPVRWKLGFHWYCSHPKVSRCLPPERLGVKSGKHFSLYDFTEGVGLGAYTKEQLSRHRKYTDFLFTRRPTQAKLTETMSSGDINSNDGILGMAISRQELEDLQDSVAGYIVPMFKWLGKSWTILSGTMMVCMIMHILASTLWRAYHILKHDGLSWKLMCALWETAFHLIHAPYRFIQGAAKAIADPLIHDGQQEDGLGSEKRYLVQQHSYESLQQQLTEAARRQNSLEADLRAYLESAPPYRERSIPPSAASFPLKPGDIGYIPSNDDID
jgi:hypothetical protein